MRLKTLLLAWALAGSCVAFAENAAVPVTVPTAFECDKNLTAPQAVPESAAQSAAEIWAKDYPNLEEMYQKALTLVRPGADHPTISVVVPAYKEERRIGASIKQIRAFFDKYPFPVEILVRIEKSPDNTVAVANAAAEGDPRIVVSAHEVQRGKGYAVRQGMLAARGDYVVFTDTDLSTPLPEIFRFLSLIADGNTSAVLIGDRRHPDSQIEAKQTVARQVMGATFQALIRTVLSTSGLKGVNDTQCGFKMFTQAASRTLFTHAQVDGFAFDIEVLMMASELGMNISAVPITWKDDDRSTVNPILDPIKMAWDVVKMRAQVRRSLRANPQPALAHP